MLSFLTRKYFITCLSGKLFTLFKEIRIINLYMGVLFKQFTPFAVTNILYKLLQEG